MIWPHPHQEQGLASPNEGQAPGAAASGTSPTRRPNNVFIGLHLRLSANYTLCFVYGCVLICGVTNETGVVSL
jgi:hypothetical protein